MESSIYKRREKCKGGPSLPWPWFKEGARCPATSRESRVNPLSPTQRERLTSVMFSFRMGVLGLEARSWAFALSASEVHKNAISVPVSGLERGMSILLLLVCIGNGVSAQDPNELAELTTQLVRFYQTG